MRYMKRAVSLLLILTCLVSCPAIVSGGASSGTKAGASASGGSGLSEVRYTKKVVSVLFDNSGSMDSNDRFEYAKYSIQMLMSLLSERDELIVTPMNKGDDALTDQTYMSASVFVDLSAPDRNAEVNRVMTNSFLGEQLKSGGTPGSSIKYSMQHLKDRGLMDSQNLAAAPENTEHWLVILTDGAFNEGSAEGVVESFINDYPSLKTIFIAFGPAAPDLSGSSLTQNYPFTAYRAPDSKSAISTMRNVANQLSGRYTLDGSKLEIAGNNVTIDLGKIDFSLKSLSVVAQDCGATLKSAVYNGSSMSISQACTIVPDSVLGMQNGYSAVVNGDPFFSGGTLTLEFSAPVAEENLSIMAEPALSIVAYVERLDGTDWVRTDEQYINANLTQGAKLRVGYEVYEQATGKLIDISSIFGNDVKTSVTYAKKSYAIGQEIVLETGNNEIAVEVSVMNGAYKMYSTVRCIIEVDPTNYRVVPTVGTSMSYYTASSAASYVVYADGNPLDANGLGAFTYTVEMTAPDGTVTQLPTTVDSSGRISVIPTAEPGVFGTYTVKFKVYNKYHISREHVHTLEYRMPAVTVQASGTGEVTASSLRASVSFDVLADGVKLTKQELTSYFKVEVTAKDPDGSDAKLNYNVMSDGTVSCTVDVDSATYGKAKLGFSVTDANGVNASHEHTIGYYPTNFEIRGEHPDKLPAGETKTDLKYTAYVDGRMMPKAELDKYDWTLVATEFDGTVFTIPATVESDGSIVATIDLSSRNFGVYDVELAIAFSDDYVQKYAHSVSYYPETLTLTSLGGLSLSEHQLTINETGIVFELNLDSRPSSFLNKIITYKLTVDGTDVTEFAKTEDNKLIYVPHADHLGALGSRGERTVTIAITCAEVPSLSRSESVTLTVTPTLFEVVPEDFGNKTVDRFDLGSVDAALYFKVLRDGVPLNCEELEEAMASGKLSLKDKRGTFTWQFWIPVGKTVTVEEVEGVPVVVYKVERDIPLIGTFPAMLIFNGDKSVVASYGDVEGTDAISFGASGAWSYIWRILVILWFIHTVMYTIGFFNKKCRRLPKGTLVTIAVSGSDSKELKPSVRPINATFMDRNGWHIVRYFKSLLFFLPGHKYWYHQPSATASGVTVLRTEKGTEQLSFSKNNIYPLRYQGGSDSAQSLSAYKAKLRNYKGYPPNRFATPVVAGDVRDMFVQVADDGAIQKGRYVPLGGRYYGRFTKEKLTAVIFFEKNLSK